MPLEPLRCVHGPLVNDCERRENDNAIAEARRLGKNYSFIAHDGCEVTVTPDGYVFHNMADWY